MIEHCLHVYLSSRHEEVKTGAQGLLDPSRKPKAEANGPSKAQQPKPKLKTKSLSDSKLLPNPFPPDSESSLDPLTLGKADDSVSTRSHLEPPPSNATSEDPPGLSDRESATRRRYSCDQIFRPLENYIIACFAGCAPLNMSFLTVRPEFQRAASEGQPGYGASGKSHIPPSGDDPVLSEVQVDAKTLLLGDIAENSSWWTGDRLSRGHSTHIHGRERSPDSWHGVVSIKSPRMNWMEVASWYRSVLNVGESWRDKWNALQAGTPSNSSVGEDGPQDLAEILAEIENDLSESRHHLKRVLLKATENLLKRPQRPIKQPEDCRFLLIILSNPLLLNSDSPSSVRRPKTSSSIRRTGPGQHSSIIKRVLGLIAHLPNDVHQFFVSWFSRLPEGQFQRIVDLIGGFVTYRLSRPPQKREWVNPTAGLVPSFSDSGTHHASQLHAALGGSRSTSSKPAEGDRQPQLADYGDDWQIRAAARVMALLFSANGGHVLKKREAMPHVSRSHNAGLTAKHNAHAHGQLIPISSFYNTMLDYADLAADFENWESNRGSFSFCQYPFFLSIYAKILLMEMEARRQMETKAREAFFDSILGNKAVSQYLVLKVRRDCLVEDSYAFSSLLRTRNRVS